MVTTYDGLLWVHFAEGCDLYQCMVMIHDVLKDKSVEARKAQYTALVCRMYMWAILEDSRYFFSQTLMPSHFATPGPKAFPRSLL